MRLRKITAVLLCVLMLSSTIPAFAADRNMTLSEDMRLTSDLDLAVASGDVLIINGSNQYYIYEMGGVLKNTGAGYVRFANTILYPAGGTPTTGSLAALVAAANGVTSITAPVKDATAITLPTVSGFSVTIKSSSNTGVISTSGAVTPPSSATTVTLVLTLTGNGGMADTGNIQVTVPAKTQSSGGDPGGSSGGGDTTSTETTPTLPPTVTGDTVSPKATTDSDTGVTSASVTVSEAQAALENALSTAKAAGTEPTVSINIPADKNATTVETTIASTAFSAVSATENTSLEIKAGDITLAFDNAALNGIDAAGTGDVKISMGVADTTKLSDAQQAEVGERPVYDFTLTKGGKTVKDFNGNITISIPYSPAVGENANAIVIYYVAADGTLQMIENGVYDPTTGKVTFATNHFSLYMVGYNLVTFFDVTSTHWGRAAIEQAAARGMVTGVGNGMYQPDRSITRAEFAQMIYNVLKLPVANPSAYDDVAENAWYYKAVMSSKAIGLFDGLMLMGNSFEPGKIITREEMAVVLAGVAKYKNLLIPRESLDLSAKYTDYSTIHQAYQGDIETIVKLGIMAGTSGSTFSPQGETTRAQAAQVQMNLLKALGAR